VSFQPSPWRHTRRRARKIRSCSPTTCFPEYGTGASWRFRRTTPATLAFSRQMAFLSAWSIIRTPRTARRSTRRAYRGDPARRDDPQTRRRSTAAGRRVGESEVSSPGSRRMSGGRGGWSTARRDWLIAATLLGTPDPLVYCSQHCPCRAPRTQLAAAERELPYDVGSPAAMGNPLSRSASVRRDHLPQVAAGRPASRDRQPWTPASTLLVRLR